MHLTCKSSRNIVKAVPKESSLPKIQIDLKIRRTSEKNIDTQMNNIASKYYTRSNHSLGEFIKVTRWLFDEMMVINGWNGIIKLYGWYKWQYQVLICSNEVHQIHYKLVYVVSVCVWSLNTFQIGLGRLVNPQKTLYLLTFFE